jgi:diguanylate cyclase (GGDEF)-like protein
VGVLSVAGIAVTPVVAKPLGPSYSVFAIIMALSIAAVVITSALLWAQSRVSRSVPLSVLAVGYALTAAVMIPYLLCYRGLWPQLYVLLSADPQSYGWLYIEWHAIFIITVFAYFILRARQSGDEHPDAATFVVARRRLLQIGVIAFLVIVPPTIWVDGLPQLVNPGGIGRSPVFTSIGLVLALCGLIAIAIAKRTGQFGALLGVWLSVACFSMCVDLSINVFSHQFAFGWYLSRLSILLAASAVLLVLLFQTATIYEQLAVTAERLRDESLTDSLTGLANRRRFDQVFAQAMRESARTKRPLALLMLDIDNFKVYNDSFGHQAGDECLRTVAQILQRRVGRARDLVARIGGEEIAVIMPEVDVSGAVVVAERLRSAVAAAAIPQGDGAVHPVVTLSIGAAATLDPAKTTTAALMAAATQTRSSAGCARVNARSFHRRSCRLHPRVHPRRSSRRRSFRSA